MDQQLLSNFGTEDEPLEDKFESMSKIFENKPYNECNICFEGKANLFDMDCCKGKKVCHRCLCHSFVKSPSGEIKSCPFCRSIYTFPNMIIVSYYRLYCENCKKIISARPCASCNLISNSSKKKMKKKKQNYQSIKNREGDNCDDTPFDIDFDNIHYKIYYRLIKLNSVTKKIKSDNHYCVIITSEKHIFSHVNSTILDCDNYKLNGDGTIDYYYGNDKYKSFNEYKPLWYPLMPSTLKLLIQNTSGKMF